MLANYYIHLDVRITVFDWNGEYSKVVGIFDGVRASVLVKYRGNLKMSIRWISSAGRKNQITNLNFSGISRKQGQGKRREGGPQGSFRVFGKNRMDGKLKQIVMLDEAWKIIGSGEISSLSREARKYGVGIVVATQMAKDITNEIISNSACLIIFRLQNQRGFLHTGEVRVDSRLRHRQDIKPSAGIVPIIQKTKSAVGQVSKNVIEKVYGIDENCILFMFGVNMRVEVPLEKFVEETEELDADAATKNKIRSFATRISEHRPSHADSKNDRSAGFQDIHSCLFKKIGNRRNIDDKCL